MSTGEKGGEKTSTTQFTSKTGFQNEIKGSVSSSTWEKRASDCDHLKLHGKYLGGSSAPESLQLGSVIMLIKMMTFAKILVTCSITRVNVVELRATKLIEGW